MILYGNSSDVKLLISLFNYPYFPTGVKDVNKNPLVERICSIIIFNMTVHVLLMLFP